MFDEGSPRRQPAAPPVDGATRFSNDLMDSITAVMDKRDPGAGV